MEAIMLFAFTAAVLYVCYWSIRHDEIKDETTESRKFRMPGSEGDPR